MSMFCPAPGALLDSGQLLETQKLPFGGHHKKPAPLPLTDDGIDLVDQLGRDHHMGTLMGHRTSFKSH